MNFNPKLLPGLQLFNDIYFTYSFDNAHKVSSANLRRGANVAFIYFSMILRHPIIIQ